jgi:hypothetical protein
MFVTLVVSQCGIVRNKQIWFSPVAKEALMDGKFLVGFHLSSSLSRAEVSMRNTLLTLALIAAVSSLAIRRPNFLELWSSTGQVLVKHTYDVFEVTVCHWLLLVPRQLSCRCLDVAGLSAVHHLLCKFICVA